MATYEQQPSYGANQHLMGGQPGPQSSYQSGPGQYGAGGFQQGAVPVYQAGFCNHAMLDESFTCCGIATAVLCFPCGLICCLGKPRKRCKQCGALLENGC